MMAEKHFIVIGNGPAGREAATTLRTKDPHSRITVISREHHGHYQSRMLPDFICGRVKLPNLFTTPFDFYEERGLKLRLGQLVVSLDLDRRNLVLDHQEVIPFSGLIIAVGGKPRLPEPMMVFEDLMLTLKTVAEAKVWIERLAAVDSVLIVGGDLTSFALTKALLELGKQVCFVFSQEAFWPMRCNQEILEAAARTLTDKGVEIVPGRLKTIARLPDARLKVATDQAAVEVGLVGAFFGLVPDVRFLAGSGLQIERGILVDEYLNTGFENVYAAGDCAQVYHPELRDYWVSIGYDNAVNLGRIAAENMTGGLEKVKIEPQSIFSGQGVRANTSWWMEF
ncbi:MAG: FAD/NAD(P)-binding oxidoreductase [Pseudomonadota bacterium]